MRQRTKLFIDFLKENNCYAKFKDNFYSNGYYDSFADLMQNRKSGDWIDAFEWNYTLEGFSYWYFKYCDWQMIVECLDK